jgi:hypothetical protein
VSASPPLNIKRKASTNMGFNKQTRLDVYGSLDGIVNNQHIIYKELIRIKRRTFFGFLEYVFSLPVLAYKATKIKKTEDTLDATAVSKNQTAPRVQTHKQKQIMKASN